jgi:hypothetical protein
MRNRIGVIPIRASAGQLFAHSGVVTRPISVKAGDAETRTSDPDGEPVGCRSECTARPFCF